MAATLVSTSRVAFQFLRHVRYKKSPKYVIVCCLEPDWFESWPLGMESELILGFQLSASSSKLASSGANQGRLNLKYKFNVNSSEIEGYGGWLAANDDTAPWFLVNFITNVTVTGIATQGVNESESWVTSYEISYGFWRNSLQDYQINGVVKVYLESHNRRLRRRNV